MADLSIFQKYPLTGEDQSGVKSMRLDHPDFADVQRTTYAKGVLSDFKVKSEDPFEVVSLVKVKIGDQETDDYVPLFYHPKKGLWDDRGGRDELGNLKEGENDYNFATDFVPIAKEEEGYPGYFNKAWMSFRCGDEIIIMLRAAEEGGELKPYAVVGFADGVPRVGENLFKMTGTVQYTATPAEAYYYAFKSLQENFSSSGTPYGTYPMGSEATDRSALPSPSGTEIEMAPMPEGFVKEAVCVTPKFKKSVYVVRTIIDEEIGWHLVDRNIVDNWVMAVFKYGTTFRRQYNYDFYWVVGPVMFCWRLLKEYTMASGTYQLAIQHSSDWDPADFIRIMTPPVWPDWADDPLNLGFLPGNITPCGWQGVAPIPTHPEMDLWAWQDWPSYEDEQGYDMPTYSWLADGTPLPFNQPLYCAVYKPELWENPNVDEMILQEEDFFPFSLTPRWVPSSAGGHYWNPESYEIFVPPHAKEELIAAEMWPREES